MCEEDGEDANKTEEYELSQKHWVAGQRYKGNWNNFAKPSNDLK